MSSYDALFNAQAQSAPQQGSSALSHFRNGALAAGGAAAVASIPLLASWAHNRLTKDHSYNQMLSVMDPADKERIEANPDRAKTLFDSLHAMNPRFAGDPLVAQYHMSKMLNAGPSAGGVVVESLRGADHTTHPAAKAIESMAPGIAKDTVSAVLPLGKQAAADTSNDLYIPMGGLAGALGGGMLAASGGRGSALGGMALGGLVGNAGAAFARAKQEGLDSDEAVQAAGGSVTGAATEGVRQGLRGAVGLGGVGALGGYVAGLGSGGVQRLMGKDVNPLQTAGQYGIIGAGAGALVGGTRGIARGLVDGSMSGYREAADAYHAQKAQEAGGDEPVQALGKKASISKLASKMVRSIRG